MKRGHIILLIVFLGLIITGIGLYCCAPVSIDDFPHPLNGIFRQWHGLFAFAGLFSIGQMWAEHIRKQMVKWRKHPDGVVHLMLWCALIVSGYWLYYPSTALGQYFSMGQVHWWLGIMLIAMLPLHASQRLKLNSVNKISIASFQRK